MTGWLLLAGAIVSEVTATVALRESAGFSRLWPTVVVAVGYAVSFWLLALVLRQLPLSMTYAVWAGAGTALTAGAGAWLFAERLSALSIAGIVLVIGGVVLLNLGGAH